MVKKNNKLEKFKGFWNDFKDNPWEKMKEFMGVIRNFWKNNTLFCFFVFLNVLNAFILRAVTIGTTDNIFSLAPILADLSFVLLVGSLGYFTKRKGIYWFIVTTILSVICMINSSYYSFYTSFSSVSLLSTLKYITAVGDAVVDSAFKLKDLVFLLSPIVFLYVLHHLYKRQKYQKISEKSKKLAFSTAMAGISVLVVFCFSLTATDIGRLTKQWNREYIVMKFGIYVYHVNDLIKSIEPKVTSLFGYDNALKTFNEYFNEEKVFKKNNYSGIFEGKNVIAIHAESIQNFVIGLEFNGVEVTPNLNKLAKKSLYFDNFYTQVSVGTSSDSEFTYATSLMPSNAGTAFGSYFNREYVTLQKLLKEKGYYTFSMHGNNADYWNRRIMYQSIGYDHFYAKDSYEIDETIGLGLSDVSFFKQSVEYIKQINEQHEKFYGTMIMLTNHTPFYDVSEYVDFDVTMTKKVLNEETGKYEEVVYPYMEGTKMGRYLKSVHYADYALGILFEELEKNGLLEDTVIVLYGDHDARLSKEDYIRLYNYDPETDGLLSEDDPNYVEVTDYTYELNRKVPFMIYSKDRVQQSEKISYVMGMYDVMPTLGNMFGVRNKYALGNDIFTIKDENVVVFPSGNWLTNKAYYNTQKNAYLVLDKSVIEKDYIDKYNAYADDLLSVSNAIIVFDLIKNANNSSADETEILKDAIIHE